MIETRANIKTIINVSGTDYDSKIDLLLPILESAIHSHCKNHFIDNCFEISNYGTDISFDTTTNRISDSSDGFGDFQDNMTIKVFGSKFNDGVYTIQTANASYLDLLGSYGTLNFDESAANGITVYKVTYPKDMKLIFAQMIKFDLEQHYGLKREKIDDYEIELASPDFPYPLAIEKKLQRYKQVYPTKI